MTIEELLEIEEIKMLRTRYALYLDCGEIDKLVALFVEDGVCEWPEHMGGHWVGREQMFENWSAVFRDEGKGEPFNLLHIATNPYIRLTGPTSATGRYYALSLHAHEPKLEDKFAAMGIHDDQYVKVDGKWYFEKTRYDFMHPMRIYNGPRIPFD